MRNPLSHFLSVFLVVFRESSDHYRRHIYIHTVRDQLGSLTTYAASRHDLEKLAARQLGQMRLLRACLVLSAALTARLVRAASPSLFSNTFPLLKRTKAQTAKSQQRERIPRKIPNYMYELYKTLTTSQSLLKPGGMPYDVNAIRAIYSKSKLKLFSVFEVCELFFNVCVCVWWGKSKLGRIWVLWSHARAQVFYASFTARRVYFAQVRK